MENMTELERKFILMARIAVALNRNGINAGVDFISVDEIDGNKAACMSVRLSPLNGENYQIETHFDFERTETELLEWWSAIEGEK